MRPDLYAEIVRVILARKKAGKIVLFGSRARGDFRETSDIDLAVFGTDWNDSDINLAKDALEEKIKTPLKMDLVHFDSLKNERLQEKILKEGKVLYESRPD